MGSAGPSPGPACAALGRLPEAPGRSQPPASRASSLRQEGAPGLDRLGSGRQTELLPPFCFLFSLVCRGGGGGVGLGCGWARGFTCGHVGSGPEASKTLAPAPR